MPALVIPNTYLAVLSGTNLGTPWANVHAGQFTGTALLSQSNVNEIGAAWVYGYNEMRPSKGLAWSLDKFELFDLRSETAPSWEYDFASIGGLDVDNPLAPHIALVASHKTGLRGKSYNGRTYLNGFTEGSNNNLGQVDPTVSAAMIAAFGEIDIGLAAVSSAPSVRAVASRKLLVSTPIVSTSIDSEWDRQDRRKRS